MPRLGALPLSRVEQIVLEEHETAADDHVICAIGAAAVAIVLSVVSLYPAFVFIALGAFASFRAVAHTNRADSILQRSLAASLVEEGPAVLQEAA